MIMKSEFAHMLVDLIESRTLHLSSDDRATMLQMMISRIQGGDIPHWPNRYALFDADKSEGRIQIRSVPHWIHFAEMMWASRDKPGFVFEVWGKEVRMGDVLRWAFVYGGNRSYTPQMLGVPTAVSLDVLSGEEPFHTIVVELDGVTLIPET